MGFSIYGGTGIIGSYFISMYGGRPLMREQLEPVDDEVLYLISTTSNSYADPLLHTDTNIDCLMKRLIACKEAGIKTFNFISSWFVYGPHSQPMKESDVCMPKGLYSITKRCAEQLVMDYCSHHGIKWRILRLGNVYGGPDKSTGQRNALHYIVQELKANRPVEGVGGLRRDFMHIHDICRAISLVCKEGKANSIYNIGSGQSVFQSTCISLCKAATNSKSVISYRAHRNDEQSLIMALDCSKLFALGFSPLISLEEGLTDLCTSQKFSTQALSLMAPK